MEVTSIYRNFRMSAQKVREVVRQIQGKSALDAQNVLGYVTRKSARAVAKTLKSAIANAEHNHQLRAETLVVKLAVAETARSLKRMIPKARGSAGPIIKRSCHIRIVLTDNAAN
ncbi:MAG: 50S ribosomal protein L22 [Verrucomicrobia bacterium]|nr:50S ribosomal protein L22 [Verrucomicrobiota bacterium]